MSSEFHIRDTTNTSMMPKRICKNKCKRYQVKRPASGSRYAAGQGRCQICDVWISYRGAHLKDGSPAKMGSVGWICNCCNFRIRQTPRSKENKEKLLARGHLPETPKHHMQRAPAQFHVEHVKPKDAEELALEAMSEYSIGKRRLNRTMLKTLTREFLRVKSVRAVAENHPEIPMERIKLHIRTPFRLPKKLRIRNEEGLHPDPQISLRIALLAVNYCDWDGEEDSADAVTNLAEEMARCVIEGYKSKAKVDSGIHKYVRNNRLSSNGETVSTAVAVWIAVATLHKEIGNRAVFSTETIVERIKRQELCKVSPNTVLTYITSHCVANAPANCAVAHRKTYRVERGRYRLYKRTDSYHASRKSCKIEPSVSQLPDTYKDLKRWYDEEYCAEGVQFTGRAECPKCHKVAHSKTDTEREFGFRNMDGTTRVQSWCKTCRAQKIDSER